MNPFGSLPDPQHLFSHDEAAQAFADILDARASEDEIQAFLVALTARGETMVEIAAAAQAMRERLIPIDAPEGAIDVCGTGGDGHVALFKILNASAFGKPRAGFRFGNPTAFQFRERCVFCTNP